MSLTSNLLEVHLIRVCLHSIQESLLLGSQALEIWYAPPFRFPKSPCLPTEMHLSQRTNYPFQLNILVLACNWSYSRGQAGIKGWIVGSSQCFNIVLPLVTVYMHASATYMCSSWRTTCRGQFSPSTSWVPGTELKLPGLSASVFICWVILPSVKLFLIVHPSVI